MKYVAFLDILGFKNKLKGLSQNEAEVLWGNSHQSYIMTFK